MKELLTIYIAIGILTLLVLLIPKCYGQQLSIGSTVQDTTVWHFDAATKKYQLSGNFGISFKSKGWYRKNWHRLETGMGIGLGKIYLHSYLVKDRKFFYKWELSYEGTGY